MEFLVLIIQIAFIIIATVRFKLHPVISLVLAAIFGGFGFGLTPAEITTNISSGFGNTLSSIGLVIAFGTVIGIFLERTGGTKVIAMSILKMVGLKRSALALNLAGFVISIPVYCDSGFVILSSLNKALAKKTGLPVLFFAIALATGLYSAHVFVPPTPGPLAAASILDADLGAVLLLGLIVALPVSLAGYFWSLWVGKNLLPEAETENHNKLTEENDTIVSITPFQSFLPILVPIILIAFKSIADYPSKPMGEGWLSATMIFFGNPTIALLVGVLVVLVINRSLKSYDSGDWMKEAMKQAGAIILITGAGGAFGQIIRSIDFATMLGFTSNSGIGGLFICFGIAALLKTAQGSSTVSIITTAAIVAPLITTFGLEDSNEKALAVLAIGAGAMTVSHVNDSYFWVVSQFSNMKLKTALKGHTLATLFQGLVAILLISSLLLIIR
ncbi:GntP family permease [Croceivirga thetidis]|uniref:GntP family permease n=1 Tax=Croceivirga thetidis TaxID=2721623 RepID=A0ABX1GU65_9FLAO|nr:GntP family permease [Croceivirga thetidis]NKI32591.1 GntP family permease [Croceivirga thetidis]